MIKYSFSRGVKILIGCENDSRRCISNFFDGITRNHSPPVSSSFMASDASCERSASERLKKGELALFL